MTYRIALEESPAAADNDTIRQNLDRYNVAHVGETKWQPFAIFIRDDDNTIVGGLVGGTYWGWLYVERFWSAEEVRGKGYGGRLLAMAEGKAIELGCTYTHLE